MTSHNRFTIIALFAVLWAAAACTSPAPTAAPQPAPTPTAAPVNLRIVYTSDSLGYVDPVIAVGCG